MAELQMTTHTMRAARGRSLAQTAGYYTAFIALGLVSASLGPTLPALAQLTHSGLRDISFLFMARAFGYLVGSLFSGRWYDRVAGHPLMAAVLVVIALALALVPLASVLWLLTLVMLVIGMGEGTLDVGGNALIVWVHRAKVAPFLNGLHFFFGVGAFLSPIVIAQMVLFGGGIRGAYWVLAFLLAPCVPWLLRVPSPGAQRMAADAAARPANNLFVVLIVLFFFLYTGAEVAFGGWIFTYAVALNLSDQTVAAYLTSTFWGAFTFARLLAIPIAARVQPRTLLLADLLGCLLSLTLIFLSADSLSLTWLGTLSLGVCMASIFPTLLALAARRLAITGQVTGWFFVGASAGNMFLPWLIGQLFEAMGPRVLPLTILLDLILALGLLMIVNSYSDRSRSKAV